MPKNKKAKTKHYGSRNNAELSQAEIWDDSALIRSWNDAVAEYEYYHSIHAKGEDVEEILRRAEMGEIDDTLAENDKGVSSEWHDVNVQSEAPLPLDDEEAEDGEIGEDDDALELDNELAAAKAALRNQVQGDAAEQHSLKSALGTAGEDKTRPLDGQHSTQPAVPSIGPQLPTATSNPGSSTDQTLENIKMAYYWAGYYSGVYDGQRQTHASATASAQSATQDPHPS
ncbi:hypothetical protein PV11_06598 [Exophiala sideris]|uniref:Survival Motor Neuron Gemin2-binding domain-containing protein n=1 Tax=Exophiala sideris TaxID=1016849 RepID=A0A0D1YE47_9EURO|nr:hypothetical protein PV11_06598 [Exophiala sideris]